MAGNVSDLISAGSLFVAIIALFMSVLANRKAGAMQERLVKIEEQREKDRKKETLAAELRPQLRKIGNSYRLVITNQGNGEAHNVRVMFDGIPLREHKVSVSNDIFPDLVGANSEASCLLAITIGNGPPFEFKIQWDDDTGKDRVYRTTLTF